MAEKVRINELVNYDKEPLLLVKKLREIPLTDEQIEEVYHIIHSVCWDCWDADAGCQCANDE